MTEMHRAWKRRPVSRCPRGVYIVPSLNRPKELARLKKAVAMDPIIVAEEKIPRPLPVIYDELLRLAFCEGYDFAAILADHIVPDPYTMDGLKHVFCHEGFDSVVGMMRKNEKPVLTRSEFGFVAIGRAFAKQRFYDLGQPVHCPDYHHFFADTELGRYAQSVRRFFPLVGYGLKTYHPNASTAKKDETWAASRLHKDEDKATFADRKMKRLLWGQTFERIHE